MCYVQKKALAFYLNNFFALRTQAEPMYVSTPGFTHPKAFEIMDYVNSPHNPWQSILCGNCMMYWLLLYQQKYFSMIGSKRPLILKTVINAKSSTRKMAVVCRQRLLDNWLTHDSVHRQVSLLFRHRQSPGKS